MSNCEMTTQWSLEGYLAHEKTFPSILGCCNYVNTSFVGKNAGLVDVRCGQSLNVSKILSKAGEFFMCPADNAKGIQLNQYLWEGHNTTLQRFSGSHTYIECPEIKNCSLTTSAKVGTFIGGLIGGVFISGIALLLLACINRFG